MKRRQQKNIYYKPTKFIFIHIPKTAGTSIYKWLNSGKVMMNYHHTALQYKDILKDSYKDFYKFAFVRNPWDRMVSFYRYYMLYDQNKLRKKPKKESFEAWLGRLHEYKHVPLTQLSYITDKSGNQMIDFIGRFENLKEDLRKISNTIEVKLPDKFYHEIPTHHSHYIEMYNSETKKIVDELYKDDIDYFQYTFKQKDL